MTKIIGIDPGKAGGIALLDHDGTLIDVVPMPSTERDIADIIREFATDAEAVLEKVGPTPQMGVRSAFTFGGGYHSLRMALICLGVRFREVTPSVWQRSFNLPRGSKEPGRSPAAKKNAHKARAQELFPQVKVTHAKADALLIAEWANRCKSSPVG